MPSNISKINGLTISAATAAEAQYVAAGNVDGPLGYNSITSASAALTASYIDPAFISASAAESGFGSGGGSTTAQTASYALSISSSTATANASNRIALLSAAGTANVLQNSNLSYNPSTNKLQVLSGGQIEATGITGSLNGTINNATSASFAATASYLNTLNQNLTINGNLQVFGTASYSYVSASQLNVGTNTISVNVAEPAERFGGLIVYDSGSLSHQATASFLWDSLNNKWIYQNVSGSGYDGGMAIFGPRNLNGLGNEQGTTNNAIMKGQGGDHITSSGIFDNGTDVYTNRNVQITGSLGATGSLVVTGPFQVTNGNGVYFINSWSGGTELYVSGSGFGVRDVDTGWYMLTAGRTIAGGILASMGDTDGVNNGTNVSVDDTYQTITLNAITTNAVGTLTAGNITASMGIFGTASYAVQALTASYALSSAGVAGGVTSITAGDGISVNQSTGAVTITNTGGSGGGGGTNLGLVYAVSLGYLMP
jgi:hypothetical protein